MSGNKMVPKWTYQMGNDIISKETEEDFRIVMQDNLSPEKHIMYGKTSLSQNNCGESKSDI